MLYRWLAGLGCLGILFVGMILILLSALFWGWPIMLICGACGWHIPYWPVGVSLGLGFSMISGT